eukprot:CAMPEP_0174705674 /NCGR_PEP_ID=MMETSP1094-20130205/8819_1 /TAXON_ID=156173 /ORGANISM="Chrysochromulina brevifilum, Strain UTEX LB 985" /LENGTH=127 /DNA_ID=CAMNT_0015903871 /DNA_START=82 /DNA_END=462 /DNA_ORIENTATION=+
MAASAQKFLLFCEVGPGNFTCERFASEGDARTKAKAYWCCWCCFREVEGGVLTELASGGIGFAHNSIRKHATEAAKRSARDQDARARAAAAAETRFGANKAMKPKEKPRPAAVNNDGRPDLSQPATW